MNNLDIRLLVKEKGLFYIDIARAMGVSREWLSRLMRTELTPSNKIRILTAIERLTKGVSHESKS